MTKGSSSSVVVPLGSKIDASAPSGFTACLAGTKGDDPPNQQCSNCPAGTSSTKGATECQSCDKGKFNNKPGSACQNCVPETFQDKSAQKTCVACPRGWLQPDEGSPACISLNWKTIENCKDSEYLNDTATNPSSWDCQPCPMGGDCTGLVAWTTLVPKFGWWKIPTNERDPTNKQQVFAECSFAPGCLGGVNAMLVARHPEAATSSLQHNTTCNIKLGFRNHSRLCHTCAPNFKRQGTNRCATCPEKQADNWWLMVLAFIVLMGA